MKLESKGCQKQEYQTIIYVDIGILKKNNGNNHSEEENEPGAELINELTRVTTSLTDN